MIRLLKKHSKKSQTKQNSYYKQARDATFKRQLERAAILAQQSIQHKHLSLRYLKLAMRMEFIEAMASSAVQTGMATEGVATLLNNVCSEPHAVITKLETFEKMFDDLSIAQANVQNAFDVTGGLTNPEQNQEITDMINIFNEELALEQELDLPTALQKTQAAEHLLPKNKEKN